MYEILWDMTVQCDHIIEARRPDIVVVEKKLITVDVASPWDRRVYEKESEKVEKYQHLKREIRKLWDVRRVEVVPLVVDALGAVSKRLDTWLDTLEVTINYAAENSLIGNSKDLREGIGNLKEEN